MYDSRVGSALCHIIIKYLQEKNIDTIPEELKFGYGLGRGKKNRNPNTSRYKFIEITQNRTFHFVSNIKANWLLEEIASKIHIEVDAVEEECSETSLLSKKMFALQTALFVIGEENT